MSALDGARALLPPWLAWLAAPAVVAWVLAACWAITWLAVWATRGLRPAPLDGLHWTERARLAWPVRTSLSRLGLGLPLLAFVFLRTLPFAASPVPVWAPRLVAPVLTWFAILFVGRRVSRWWRGSPLGVGAMVRIELERWLLWYPHGVVLIGAALAMPRDLGTAAAALVVATTAAIVAVHFGAGFRLARALGLVGEPSKRLRAITVAAAHALGEPTPRAFELRSPLGTAAALPWNHAVLISTHSLELLDDDQLGAVLRHELAHLGESRLHGALRLLAPLALVPMTLFRPLAAVTSPLVAVYAAIGLSIVQLPLRSVSRRLEERADSIAIRGPADPTPYVAALVTLHRDGGIPAVDAKRGSHPPLYDRMLAAGVMPDFPRPAPPTGSSGGATRVILLLGLALSLVADSRPFWDMPPLDDAQQRAVTIEMLFTGGTAAELAEQRLAAGRADDAITLLSAAIAVDDWWGYRGQLASLLADAGRCEAAWRELGLARGQAARPRRDILGREVDDAIGSERLAWIDDREDRLDERCPREPAADET